MNLEERRYSLLAISNGAKFNHALNELLPKHLLSETYFASSVSEGKRMAAEREFDFVLVNSPLPDSAGINFAVDLCQTNGTIVLLLVRAELHEDIFAKTAPRGVFTLSKPTSGQMLNQALCWMVSARERLRQTGQKSLSLEEKMAEIRLVNRAKWVLIEACGMDEPQAHRYIEKQAMGRRMTKREIAQEILQGGDPEEK